MDNLPLFVYIVLDSKGAKAFSRWRRIGMAHMAKGFGFGMGNAE